MIPVPADRFLPFLVVAILLIVAPGPDFAMVTRNAIFGGRGAGVATALGVATGTAVWSAASVAGIATLLSLWATAFFVLKLAGGAYLIFLGARAIVAAVQRKSALEPPALPSTRLGRTPYRRGLMCNVLNPKAAVIFTSIIPQFVVRGPGASGQLAELGLAFVFLVAAWLSLYSMIAGSFRMVLQREAVRRVVDGITGSVLVALGLRLATDR